MTKIIRKCLLAQALLATALLGSAAISQAASIVDISPNSGTSYHVGGPSSQVEAISWTQTGTYTGVSISALVGSIDGNSETVDAYLTTGIGSTAGSAVASSSITVANFASAGAITSANLFSGLTLGAGSYYLTLFTPDTTGNVRWASGSSTSFGAGVSGNGEFFANTSNGTPNTTNPWQSSFVSSGSYSDGFTVTGTVTTPIPSAIWMVGSTLLGLIGLGRHKLSV